jgi:hypothetical protein
MAELFIGAAVALTAVFLVWHVRTRSSPITWWQWLITALGLLYAVFVAEVVVAFIKEGSLKGAVVMGTLLGFVAVVWGVLLARFVFRDPVRLPESPAERGGVA